jgi:hypothetical protein
MRRTTLLVVCTLALCAGSAFAGSEPPDTLKVDYFANTNISPTAAPALVRLTNPGTNGGGLCAAIFVFDANQEMSECCSCYLSPDGLRTLSLKVDLISNELTGVVPITGDIKIVSTASSGTTCPTYPTSLSPVAGLRGWGTHIQSTTVTTETVLQDATLSTAEVSRLDGECYGIQIDGSGKGLCTCGTGD